MLLWRAVGALFGVAEAVLHFRFLERGYLGTGAWGFVLLATERATGLDVAVKVVPQHALRRAPAAAAQEAAILRACLHPNIVRLVHAFSDAENAYLATELFRGGTLEDLLLRRRGAPLREAQALALFAQLASALAYLHARGVVHRDLSLANVGLDAGRVKLFDFGLAHVRRRGGPALSAEFNGTPQFWAPELFARAKHVPEAAEMWAAGIILLALLVPEIAASQPTPLRPDEVRAVLASPLLGHVSVATLWLLARLLHFSPCERPSAEQALREVLRNPALYEAAPREVIRPSSSAHARLKSSCVHIASEDGHIAVESAQKKAQELKTVDVPQRRKSWNN